MKRKKSTGAVGRLLQSARGVSEEKGFFQAVSYAVRTIGIHSASPFVCAFHRWLMPSEGFTFNGKRYRYFCHRYNTTWRNERAVEVPIIREMVDEHQGKRVLEVGNVLSHYFPVRHDILDKYEKARGVINRDVVGFRPRDKYDLIVSISTLEHVGRDEEVRDPEKILRAIENLRKCLAPKGMMAVTLPLGYNRDMDEMLIDGRLRFDEGHYMKRVPGSSRWEESSRSVVRDADYDFIYNKANGLVIGIMHRK
jgi:SAM-dependent methyltransferase